MRLIETITAGRAGALILSLIAMVQTGVPAAVYHVSSRGNDTASGTESQPWRTIQKAVDSVKAGDIILAGAGIYGENVTWSRAASGTAASPIVLDGQSVATVYRLQLSRPHWTIRNFTIRGYNETEFLAPVKLENHAHYITFANNMVDNAGALYRPGIELSTSGGGPFNDDWPSNCVFRNNIITGVKAKAALIMSGRNNLFVDNTVKDLISADMLRLFGENNIIRGNRFSNNVLDEGLGYHPDFVQTFGNNGVGSRGHIIERNLIIDSPTQIAQLVEGTAAAPELIGTGAVGNWTFRNNVFANFKLGTSLTIPNVKWYNNVFYKCNYSGGHAIGAGYGDRGSSEGIRIVNNVFLDCGLLDRDNSGWYTINEAYEDKEFNYNYVAKNGFRPVREENPPSGFRWYEPNGINGGDPGFVNPAAYDFRLRPDSILIGRGMRIAGFNDDFNGNVRPSAGGWDIGPFQFVEGDESGTTEPPPPPQNLRVVE